jgi:hypothetical protein
MNTWRIMIISTALAFLMGLGNMATGESVTGYSSYVSLLPGGKDRQAENFNVIESAQDEVRVLEAEKRNREIKFDRPVDIHFLNDTYTMISFDVFFKPKDNSRFSTNPAIFALLFQGTGRKGLTGYTSKYIRWIGASDIEEYHSSDINDFCSYFRRSGVEDCVPSMVKRDGPAISQKAMNADRITGGVVKEAFIDPSIARKKDVDDRIEKTNALVEELNEKLRAVLEKNDHLQRQVDGQEKELAKFASSPRDSKTPNNAPPVSIPDDKAVQMTQIIKTQADYIHGLEDKIQSLQNLLEGVSRTRNTLMLSGINLQIVNGTGETTGTDNGTGNLIIGYNEKKPGEPLNLGSHKIIVPEDPAIEPVTVSALPANVKSKPEKQSFWDKLPESPCFIEGLLNP